MTQATSAELQLGRGDMTLTHAPHSYHADPSRSSGSSFLRTSDSLTPAMDTVLRREVDPRTTSTFDLATPKTAAIDFSTALLAFPLSAGAVTEMRRAESWHPPTEGCFALGVTWTSIVHRSSCCLMTITKHPPPRDLALELPCQESLEQFDAWLRQKAFRVKLPSFEFVFFVTHPHDLPLASGVSPCTGDQLVRQT